ncbi:protein FAM162B [Betta splendens]|uniref:Protein FAM162B n=1 Tax=Betta splendens TaxID=158456 RepID=A0A6P7M960_BETSP|nr:protein FAM162B [Betta splendens]
MSFARCRLSVGKLLGQRISQTWSQRGMCLKPQEVKERTPSGAGFKLPGYKPSEMDKRMLLWSGRFKSADQIPEFVAFETIEAARTRMRVKFCYVMIVSTLAACVLMVIQGKKAARRDESLTAQNLEKKAKLKAEALVQKSE